MSVFLTLGYIVNGSFRLPPQSQGQSLVLTFTTVSLSQTDFSFFFGSSAHLVPVLTFRRRHSVETLDWTGDPTS